MIRQLSWLWGGNVMALVLGVIASGCVARMLSPGEMGKLGLFLSISFFFNAVFINWTQTSLLRFGKESLVRTGQMQKVWLLRISLLLISFGAVLVFFLPPIASLWAAFLNLQLNWVIAVLAIFGVIVLGLQAEIGTLAQIYEQFSVVGCMSMARQAFWVVALLILLWWRVQDVNAVVVLSLYWFVGLVTAFFGVVAVIRMKKPHHISGLKQEGLVVTRKQMVFHSLPLVVTFFVGYLSNYGDHWLINNRLTVDDVGQFYIIYQLFILLTSLPAPFSSVLLPRMIQEDIAGKGEAEKKIQNLFPALNVVWLIFLICSVSVMPEFFNLVYTGRYSAGLIPLICLVSGASFSLLTSVYSPFFSVQSGLGRNALYAIIMTALNLIISWFLLPIVGILGSAIGTVISYWVGALFYVYDQQRHYGVRESSQIAFGFIAVFIILMNIPLIDHIFVRVIWDLVGVCVIVALASRKSYFNVIKKNVVDMMKGVNKFVLAKT